MTIICRKAARLCCVTASSIFALYANCQSSFPAIDDALAKNQFRMVINKSISNEEESYILDACSVSEEFSNLGYEDLKDLLSSAIKDSKLSEFLKRKITIKEKAILAEIDKLSIEQIVRYINSYPMRKEFVLDHLSKTLKQNLKQLSLQELLYLQSTLPYFKTTIVEEELKNREQERHSLMAAHIEEFLKNERDMSSQLKYMLESITWTFFIEGHKQLTNAYSKIYMVPDNPSSAASQYQRIVKVCFAPHNLQKLLQAQVDKYCEQVNKARQNYAKIAGKDNYKKCNFIVPTPIFNSNASITPFNGIYNSREVYLRGRQNVSKGASVIGFLFGGLWGLGIQALGEWLNISSLVDEEYNSRLKYVNYVHNALERSMSNYNKQLIKKLHNYIIQNQKEYEMSITQ